MQKKKFPYQPCFYRNIHCIDPTSMSTSLNTKCTRWHTEDSYVTCGKTTNNKVLVQAQCWTGKPGRKNTFKEFIIFYLTKEHFSLEFFCWMVHQQHRKNVKLTSDKKKDVTANPFPSILIISVKCPPDCHRMMLPSSSDDTIRPPCASSSQMAVLCEVSVSCSLTAVPRGGMSNTMIPPSEVPKITNLLGVTNLSKHTYVDRELHVHHHMCVKY